VTINYANESTANMIGQTLKFKLKVDGGYAHADGHRQSVHPGLETGEVEMASAGMIHEEKSKCSSC